MKIARHAAALLWRLPVQTLAFALYGVAQLLDALSAELSFLIETHDRSVERREREETKRKRFTESAVRDIERLP